MVMVITLFITYTGGTAFAASKHSFRPLVSCSGNGCNGQDPQGTGCSSGGQSVPNGQVNSVFDQDGVLLFTLELRWSPTCQTNWARINNSNGAQLQATITRTSDGLQYCFPQLCGATSGATGVQWTPMVFAPTVVARACASSLGTVDPRTRFSTCISA